MYEPKLLLQDQQPQMQPPTDPMTTGEAFEAFRNTHGVIQLEQTDRLPIVSPNNPDNPDAY
jgi:hypothetical protein